MLVHFLFSEIGHDACLTIGSPFDCVVDDPVKVAVNCSLIHLDYFLIETLFSGPNDFFCISATGFSVVETGRFAATAPACRFATQSGPMLVIEGALHPRFLPGSASRHVRNGVGVTADGTTAYFVISDAPVNFADFARVFRDALKTPNALYFDGKVSRLYAPELQRDDIGFPMGPIVALAAPGAD